MNRAHRTGFSTTTRGFSLVAAIFVLVVLAALGIFIITIGEVQRSIAIAAAQGARAYYAAESGLEWGIYRAVPPTSSCAASSPVTPTGAGFNGFSVTVTCTQSTFTEAGNPNVTVYVITSTATFGNFGTRDYFARTLQATVTNAP